MLLSYTWNRVLIECSVKEQEDNNEVSGSRT